MKTISKIILVAIIAMGSLVAETKQECIKNAMKVNNDERKECNKKTNADEKKTCRKETADKLTAAKNACNESAKN